MCWRENRWIVSCKRDLFYRIGVLFVVHCVSSEKIEIDNNSSPSLQFCKLHVHVGTSTTDRDSHRISINRQTIRCSKFCLIGRTSAISIAPYFCAGAKDLDCEIIQIPVSGRVDTFEDGESLNVVGLTEVYLPPWIEFARRVKYTIVGRISAGIAIDTSTSWPIKIRGNTRRTRSFPEGYIGVCTSGKGWCSTVSGGTTDTTRTRKGSSVPVPGADALDKGWNTIERFLLKVAEDR